MAWAARAAAAAGTTGGATSSRGAQLRGVDSLLVAAAGYKRKDPVGEEVWRPCVSAMSW